VANTGDVDYAAAGGNVCAIAQRRETAAFVLDGVVRDLAEIREMGFPVFARGVIPVPGRKSAVMPLNQQVRCGGVAVNAGDIVVADEEGVVVVPCERQQEVLTQARAKLSKETGETLDDWERAHSASIDRMLAEHGFTL